MDHASEAPACCHSEVHLNTLFCYSSAPSFLWEPSTGSNTWLPICVSFWLLCADARTHSVAQEDMQTLAHEMLESRQC